MKILIPILLSIALPAGAQTFTGQLRPSNIPVGSASLASDANGSLTNAVGATVTLKVNVNLNNGINTDVGTITVPFSKWVLERSYAVNVAGNNVPLSALALYTGAGATGDNVGTATVCANFGGTANAVQSITLPTLAKASTATTIIVRETAVAASAATADVYVVVRELP